MFQQRAGRPVGAGLWPDAEIAATGPAVFRFKGGGFNAELLHGVHGGREPIHIPDVIAPALFDGETVDTDVPIVLLAAADLEVVPGALAISALHLRHHHHDLECVAHAAANAGDSQRHIVHELVFHRGRHFRGFGPQWRRFGADVDALAGLADFKHYIDAQVVITADLDSGARPPFEPQRPNAHFTRPYRKLVTHLI